MSVTPTLRPPRTTPRLQLPIPGDSNPADYVTATGAIADGIDSQAAIDLQGPLSARPPAGVAGRYYYDTADGGVFRDTGSGWVTVKPSITTSSLPANPQRGDETLFWTAMGGGYSAGWRFAFVSPSWAFVGGPMFASASTAGFSLASNVWATNQSSEWWACPLTGVYDVTVFATFDFFGQTGTNGAAQATWYDFTGGTLITQPSATLRSPDAGTGPQASVTSSARLTATGGRSYGLAFLSTGQNAACYVRGFHVIPVQVNATQP